jgi:hypothetical protein
MAFCTSCGAKVEGAFCGQCGTPVSAASEQAGGPAAAPAIAAVPAKRTTSPLVWVLIVVLALFILAGIGVAGIGFFLARHPGEALARIITAGNPNVEIVRTDDGARSITVRDRRTGKETTLSFEDIKNGRFRITGDSDNGGTATVEFGAGGGLPSWVPEYPGAKEHGNFAVRGDNGGEMGEGGNFIFTTSDPPSKVIEFYRQRATEMGMDVRLTSTGGEGGVLVATSEGDRRALHVAVGPGTTVNVSYGQKR